MELPLFSPPADSSVPDEEEDRASFCGQEEEKDTPEFCETDKAIDTDALILR